MRALPKDVNKEDQLTGVTCVDCPGVVQIRREGKAGYLRFECRVGHAFSETELLEGKERRIEEWLRAALLGVEELSALLRDLEAWEAEKSPVQHPGYARRRAVLEVQARRLRELLGANEPVDLLGAERVSGAAPADGGAAREDR